MAKIDPNSQDLTKNNKKISSLLNLLRSNMDDLHQDTFISTPKNNDTVKSLKDSIEKSVSDIVDNSFGNTSAGNISKMLSKVSLDDVHSDKKLIGAMSIFEDKNLTDSLMANYAENKWISDFDSEIDMILKYMPKLQEALNCKQDYVLSADNFAKEFLNYNNNINREDEQLFSKRFAEMERVYKTSDLIEDVHMHTQKYGEDFVYIVPYSTAFKKLLIKKQNTKYSSNLEQVIFENGAIKNSYKDNLSKDFLDKSSNSGFGNLKITFNRSGLLESSYTDLIKYESAINELPKSCSAIHEASILEAGGFDVDKHLISDGLELEKIPEDDKLSHDAIYSTNDKKDAAKVKINVPGCVVRRLKRKNIRPIYMEDNCCLGYYYLEFKQEPFNENFSISGGMSNSALTDTGISRGVASGMDRAQNRNLIVNYIAKKISDGIDANFINANQDLRKEIYMILKHNEIFNSVNNSVNGDITVTFIPAEDIVHTYFKLDPKTKRGISDLAGSIFPATLYACLYISHTLGTLTRGNDKRVYYIKQNVETNIAKTMMNVLNQIKKGNFNARQMESLSNVLNMTGKFNDLLIPTPQNGEAPISFEIIPGQEFNFQSELMDKLEEMAINPTDIPLEAINARQTLDYAIQATMSSSKVMRTVYKRQNKAEAFASLILSKIYNYEYGANNNIEVMLPSPNFLNMNNGAQLINSTVEYATAVANNEMAGRPDEEKAEFIRLMVRNNLGNHMNVDKVERFKKLAAINVAIVPKKDDTN